MSQPVPFSVGSDAKRSRWPRFAAMWLAIVLPACGSADADSDQRAIDADAASAPEGPLVDAAAQPPEMPDAHQEEQAGEQDCPTSVDALLRRIGERPPPRVQCGLYRADEHEMTRGTFDCFHQQAFEKGIAVEFASIDRCGVDSCGDKKYFVATVEGRLFAATFYDSYGARRGAISISRCEGVQIGDGDVSCVGATEIFACLPANRLLR